MRRTAAIAFVIGALAATGGCRKKPADADPLAARVSVQRPTGSTTGHADWATTIFPARYADVELPAFPPEAIEAEVTGAAVRADFTVLPDGRAHDVRFELIEPVAEGERFVAACAAALERWRFSPAWRLTRNDEPGAVVLLPSKAHLIFHFDLSIHRQGGDVGLTFEPGGP